MDLGQHRLARLLAAPERRHRHLIDADNAHDLLDDIGLAVHVATPRGDRDLHNRAAAGHHETEMGEDAPHLDRRHVDAGEPLDLGQRKLNHAVVAEALADHDVLRGRAAADLHHQARCQLQPRHHEGRIDAALETIAGVRIDAELAAGVGDVDLVPQRRFDQHVGRVRVAAGGFAAHDARERFDVVIVRDHAHAGIERIGAAIERQQRFAITGAAHGEIAAYLPGVEHVEGAGAVVRHEVGDIDQRVDRPQADRAQSPLQPFRGRPVLDPPYQPHREAGTKARIFDRHVDRAGEFTLDRLDAGIPELAHVGG